MNKKIFVLFFAICFYCKIMHAQASPFIDKTIERLRNFDTYGKLDDSLNIYYKMYLKDAKNCETQNFFPAFIQKLTEQCAKYNLVYSVLVSTKKAGAKIKFSTIYDEGNGKPAKEIQSVKNIFKKNIPSGIYFFWTERNGQITSEKTKIFLQQNMNISLDEK